MDSDTDAGLLHPIGSVWARCADWRSVSVERQITLSLSGQAVVFVGTVTDVRAVNAHCISADWECPERVTLLVKTSFKDANQQYIVLANKGGSPEMGYEFTVGRTYLVYAYREPREVRTSICSRTRPIESAAQDIRVLNALTGHK